MDEKLGKQASKLTVHNNSAYAWGTYTEILQSGKLDHIDHIKHMRGKEPVYGSSIHNTEEWKGKLHGLTYCKSAHHEKHTTVAPSSLLFFAHLPSTVHGEQLLAQFIAAVANRLWLFQYSRMPIAVVCSEQMAMVSQS